MTKKFIILNLSLVLLQGVTNKVMAQESFSSQYNISYINMNEGLLHNNISDIFKDKHGFVWISTKGGGLSRYDGFDFVHFNTMTNPLKIKSNFVIAVCEDDYHRLWVISDEGTNIIDLKTLNNAKDIEDNSDIQMFINKPATKIIKDANGDIWLFCETSLHKISFNSNGKLGSVSSTYDFHMLSKEVAMEDVDADGSIWLGYRNIIYRVINKDNKLRLLIAHPQLKLDSDVVIQTMFHKDNELWIGTISGLYRFNRNNSALRYYGTDENNIRALSHGNVTDIVTTNYNQLLVSTLGGINIYHPTTDDFEQFTKISNVTRTVLNSDYINCMLVDKETIWIGSDVGGIDKMTRKRLSIVNYLHDKNNPNSISQNPVNAIYEDDQETLWIGNVEGGLNKKQKNKSHFVHYNRNTPTRLSHNTVSSIITDNKYRLWVGTWGMGITIIDLKDVNNKVLKYITPTQYPQFSIGLIESLNLDTINNIIWIGTYSGLLFYDLINDELLNPFHPDIANIIPKTLGSEIDSYGNLWIGSTENGLYIIDLHSRKNNKFSFKHFKYRLDAPESKLRERITCIYEASDSVIWIGSDGSGIYKCNRTSSINYNFTNYSSSRGLISNNIRGILEDDNGMLWISTNNGLSYFDPKKETFENFTEEDGLINNQFYWNAFYKTRDGKLYFGGINGLSAINSVSPIKNETVSKVVFTRLKVKNKEVLAGSRILKNDISMTKDLQIEERDNSFSIDFSPLNYRPTSTTIFYYRLLGFEDEFIKLPVKQNSVNYTNIPPGKYLFQVKYLLSGDFDNASTMSELKIKIKPFFYKTWWFISCIIFLIIGLVCYLYYRRIYQLRKQQIILNKTVEERTKELRAQNLKINQQNDEIIIMSKKLEELTNYKISFFTNITHEFRTPLTLIIGPIKHALKLSNNTKVIEQLQFVERNSKYLLSLVNQLMDFRKVEAGEQQIMNINSDFIKFLDTLFSSFEAFASERSITITKNYHLTNPVFLFDPDALQKVFTNLLSNAIKFTPNEGKIDVYIATISDNPEKLYICIKDSGIGINEEDIPKIFDRFYQSSHNKNFPVYGQSSTGIGLYLVNQIVRQLGGKITVKTNNTLGSSFRIILPIEREAVNAKEPEDTHENNDIEYQNIRFENHKPSILIVEDNLDMRKYIASILEKYYNTIEAENGMEAITLLKKYKVDFIISDLMMPEMDGIELSKNVKQNLSTSHIPFLMLTAKTSEETQLESYQTGVDEFISKPFSEELMLARIHNMLESRKRYQQRFALNMDVIDLQIDEESRDKKFIDKLMEMCRLNYHDPQYGTLNLVNDMSLSKSALNNKMQDLIGQSIGQFLKNYRLTIAYEMIKKNRLTHNMNISEIAYNSGFNDPKYFTRCFVKRYNLSPSDLMKQTTDNE